MLDKLTEAMCGTVVALAWFVPFLTAAPPDSAFREASFEAQDGGRVYANLYGEGDHAVVLAHGAIFNKESWDALSRRLAGSGYQALAIDFRGYGKSKPGTQGRALHLDVLAAIDYLHRSGVARVSVIGGSMGGGAAAQAAAQSKPGSIDRLILLAHSPIREPDRLTGDKLFVVSKSDGIRGRVEQQFAQAPEPKKLVLLDGSAHAQHIFKTTQSDELTRLILEWLADR